MSKVLIACPLGDGKEYSINEWFGWIAHQSWQDYDVCVCVNGRSQKSIDEKKLLLEQVLIRDRPLIVLEHSYEEYDTMKMRLMKAREKIRSYAVAKGYDYLFFLDSDTIPVLLDSIQLLVNQDKSVVSGLYCYKGTAQPVVLDLQTVTNVSIKYCEELMMQNVSVRVWGFGFGCVLIHKDVFSKVPFRYSDKKENWTEDFVYCEALDKENIDRWFYPRVACRHMHAREFIVHEVGKGDEEKGRVQNSDERRTET